MRSFRLFITAAFVILFCSCSQKTVEPKKETRLLAVGDIMLGRHIGKIMAKRGVQPFERIRDALRQCDMVFGNLEAGIADDTASPMFPLKPYNFAASPKAVAVLKDAGFTVLSLANNHALDFGTAQLAITRSLLPREGISCFGAGQSLEEAREPVIIMKNGIRFGFLGYGIAHSNVVYATENRPGIAPLREKLIEEDIRKLRPRADIVVVSYHWGIEYQFSPTQDQRRLGHSTVDWGADLVLGHHPHVMQGIEIYKGKVIAYSLGNFIFDQKGKGTDRSFILACTFREKELVSVETIPLDRFKAYLPKVADGSARNEMLGEIWKISSPLNAQKQALNGFWNLKHDASYNK